VAHVDVFDKRLHRLASLGDFFFAHGLGHLARIPCESSN
jgi:hypothetical protein